MPPIPVDYYYAGASDSEKSAPPGAPATEPRRPRSTARRLLRWAVLAAVLAQGLFVLHPEMITSVASTVRHSCAGHRAPAAAELCAQEDALVPRADVYAKVGEELATEDFRMRAVKWHSGAVQIPTESYDKMKAVGEDPRWEAFGPFHDYLEKSFPLV
jgi:hypothetical protein